MEAGLIITMIEGLSQMRASQSISVPPAAMALCPAPSNTGRHHHRVLPVMLAGVTEVATPINGAVAGVGALIAVAVAVVLVVRRRAAYAASPAVAVAAGNDSN